MAQPATQTAKSTGDRIAAAALSLAQANSFATYASPPKSSTQFDCSYFVGLVLKQVSPTYKTESSAMIAKDRSLFQPVAGQIQPGDIVYFPPGQVPYEVSKGNKNQFPGHVAIMLSAGAFIGMQSKGIGKVNVPDVWWWSRQRQFFRYIGPAS